MFSLEYCGSCANYVWQIFLRWCCFLPQCQRMCWKWPKNSWEIQFEFLWKRKNWLLKESNSFILMLKEKNESWIHFVTCTRHWQLHRLFFKVDWLTEKMHARDFTVSALVRAWWHGPERKRCYHEGISIRVKPCSDHYWPVGKSLNALFNPPKVCYWGKVF